MSEIRRKQTMLRQTVRQRSLRLKYHDRGISFVEGVLARGDRRLADVIELVWRRGSRFDSWDELFDLGRWEQAFTDCNVDTASYLGTRPVHARLPWDHIDIGLEDGFLLSEYRKAVKNRLSPPCGKVVGELIHATNLKDAHAEARRLVCYDCGVACDLTKMRNDRLVHLATLNANEPPPPRTTPMRSIRSPKNRRPPERPELGQHFKYRLKYTKLGRAAFVGHLDTIRMLARMLRRAEIAVAYTRGFHPKPAMDFSPALALGVQSLGELVDVTIEGSLAAEEVLTRLREVSPEGVYFASCHRLGPADQSIAKTVTAYDLAIRAASDGIRFDAARLARLADRLLKLDTYLVDRKQKQVDIRCFVEEVLVIDEAERDALCNTLQWDTDVPLFRVRVGVTPTGSAKPMEIAKALGVWGQEAAHMQHAQLARLGFPVTVRPGARAIALTSVA